MSLDLGDLAGLAKAVGLLDGDDAVVTDWFASPGSYLSAVLANDVQRAAMLDFADEALGDSTATSDSSGRRWLPLASVREVLTLAAVVDERPTEVHIGVGVRVHGVADNGVTCDVEAYVPLFATARGEQSPVDAVLLGTDRAALDLDLVLTLPAGTESGGVALSSAALGATMTTGPVTETTFNLSLLGLQLPGSPEPTDIVLDSSSVDALDDVVLQLVLGLLRAQADGTTGPLHGLATMLGLTSDGPGGVPDFPIADVLSRGPVALLDWFALSLSDEDTRNAWLAGLAELIDAPAPVDGEVRTTLDGATLVASLTVVPGPAARPVVTPHVALTVPGTTGVRLALDADLVRLDLATGSATALPALSVTAELAPAGGGRLLDPVTSGDLTVAVGSLRAGLALDESRRPVLVLAALDADVGASTFDVLDLSSAEALTAAAEQVVTDAAATLLAGLGDAGEAVAVLVGLADPPTPPGAPSLPRVDVAALLADPLGAVAAHWSTLLSAHADRVPDVLAVLWGPVSGTGEVATPWRMPIVDGLALLLDENAAVGVEASRTVAELPDSGVSATFLLRATLVDLDLSARTAGFLPTASARLALTESGGGRLRLGGSEASVSTDAVGLVLSWSASGGLAVAPSAGDVRLVLPAGEVPLPIGTPEPDAWAAVELLFGTVAKRLAGAFSAPWIEDVATLLGWLQPVDGSAVGPHLPLGDLVTDPQSALRAFTTQLLDVHANPEAVDFLRDFLVSLVGDLLSGLAAPSDAATTLLEAPYGWTPGDPGLTPSSLVLALAGEAGIDDGLEDMLADRGDLAAGLGELLERWSGTDGLAVLREADLPTGVAGYAATDLPHTTRLDGLPLGDVVGSLPDTVVYVGVDAPGCPQVFPPDVPAERTLDLRGADLPPEAFALPTPDVGTWSIRLAGRAEAGDIAGQAARLRRVLAPLASVPGGIVVVAHGGAGHAAVEAVAAPTAMPGVQAVVTVGTPWSALSVDVLDRVPASESLRLLGTLLTDLDSAGGQPADGIDEPDDPDLALGRGLVDSLLLLDGLDDPLRELRPPATPAVPNGIAVHAVVGSTAPASVLRGVTAIVTAALARRARDRAASGDEALTDVDEPLSTEEPTEPTTPTPVRAGVHVPVVPAVPRAGLVAKTDLDLTTGVDGPALDVSLVLTSETGWLVGGPDPGRTPGVARPLALRRLTARVTLPLTGTGTASTSLVLHDMTAVGVAQARVEVSSLVPEVRAVLGQVSSRITGDLQDALTALGVLGPDALGGTIGLDTVALERWLLDPAATAQALLDDPAARAALASALRRLAGDTSSTGEALQLSTPVADVTVDLAARSVTVTAGGATPVPWSLTVLSGADEAFAFSARIGPRDVELLLDGLPLSVRLRTPTLGAAVPETVLWPAPDPDAVVAALLRSLPGGLVHLLLDTLRTSLSGLAPTAAATVDALLDALGLLGVAVEPDTPRPTRLPAPLMADPVGYLHSVATPAVLVPALLDAVRDLLGGTGAPGSLVVADGVTLRASADSGALALGVDVDGSAFPAPAGLVPSGNLDLVLDALAATAPPLPSVAVALDVPDVGAARLTVSAAGVTLALVPDSGAEIPLLPAGPGLGGLASAAGAAAVRALPPLLDAVAARDPAGAPGTATELAGRLVARLGDALALRTGTGPATRFDGDALAAFGTSPAAALSARAPTLASTGLPLVRDAVEPLLGPASRTVTVSAGALVVSTDVVTLSWRPGTNRVDVTVTASDLPGVQTVTGSASVDLTGLLALDVTVGPAELTGGGVTLSPYARLRAGSAVRSAEVGLDVGPDQRFAARWTLAPVAAFGLLAVENGIDSQDPVDVVLAAVAAVLDLTGSVVLALSSVQQALDTEVLGEPVRDLLAGALLDAADPARLADGLLDPDLLPDRLAALLDNLATAPGAEVVIDNALELRAHVDGDTYGLTLGLRQPYSLGGTDVTFTLEADASWISDSDVPAGLTLDVLTVDSAGVVFSPALTVGGVGLRMGRVSGPLLDAGVTIDTVAVHTYAALRADAPFDGGVQLETAGLAVPLAGASGGDNAVAQGLMASGTDDQTPQPAFSPALAVQRVGTEPTAVTLRAGPGTGPWWLVIQREFGPIYLEQVGFEVTMAQDQIGSFGVLLDGKVSLVGLSASVDDLRISYLVSVGSPLDASSWQIDLAGFAVTADMSGIVLAGGLRKFPVTEGGVEYLGMLTARFAVYGLSVYGGYGLVGPPGDTYASLFLFGAVNGPIGGPPAFFVTGIGGGFGINRALVYPADLSTFGTFPFIKALDPAARPGDPMAELAEVRGFFPAERGTFWFAAGLSFTSFALVDGVAVVAVEIGQGFELSLLGLARMALPRPEAALVSVELGLIARFSSSEGVLLVQAQLTDNSWLLDPSVRLTGGFAFATWFSGVNRGQFVLTLGGYHPTFRRDGYPVVPRLGIDWRVSSAISIVGESYFALTSEAVMAGARIEASCDFGPAWAHLVVGADGIVFFDPFWLSVTVYASISAGVTVDVWIGEITISVSLSARVTIEGPPFHGRATFGVGPVDLTVEFGDNPTSAPQLSWAEFVAKYLEEAEPGVAHTLTTVPGLGALPPAGSDETGGESAPDGSEARPFRVSPEFTLTVTSTVPVRTLLHGTTTENLPTVPEISVAPMRAAATPTVRLRVNGPRDDDPDDRVDRLEVEPQQLGAYAVGTFGPPQDAGNPKVPTGDVIPAVDRVLLTGTATVATSTGGAPSIEYRQVETTLRRVNPFVVEGTQQRLDRLAHGSDVLAGLVPEVEHGHTALDVATDLLATRAERSPADVIVWAGQRAAEPMLGSLAEGLGNAPTPVRAEDVTPQPPPEPPAPRPPVAAALLAAPARVAPTSRKPVTDAVTTVSPALFAVLTKEFGQPPVRTAAAPLSSVDARLEAAVPARLMRMTPPALDTKRTVVAAGTPAETRTGRGGVESVGGRGSDPQASSRLAVATKAFLGGGADLTDGDVAVFRLRDADRDVTPKPRPQVVLSAGRARLVLLRPGGQVAADSLLAADADRDPALTVPAGVRTVVAVGGSVAGAVAGWLADVPAPYVGDEVWLGAGCVARSANRVPPRGLASAQSGWVAPDLLVAGDTAVTTEFARPVRLVAVELGGGGASADGVALGIDGARRPLGSDGREKPPALVADGSRTVLVYEVLPAPTAGPEERSRGRVSVTVVTAAGRRLAGVAAVPMPTGPDQAPVGRPGDMTATQLAEAAAAGGLAALVPPVTVDGLGRSRLHWKGA